MLPGWCCIAIATLEPADTTCALSGSISVAGSQLKSGFACAGLLCSPAQNASRVLPYHVCDTQARVEELLSIMQAALDTGMLARVDGEKRGRLQFAPNQLFGRRFENCLRERTERPRLAGPEIINLELEAALRLMMGLLEKNSPRTVDARHFDWFRMYVDASFEPVAIQAWVVSFWILMAPAWVVSANQCVRRS